MKVEQTITISLDKLQVGMIFDAPLLNKKKQVMLPEYCYVYPDFIEECNYNEIKELLLQGTFATEKEIQKRVYLPTSGMSLELRQAIHLYYESVRVLKQQYSNPRSMQIGDLQKLITKWIYYLTVHKNPQLYIQVIRYANPSEDDYFYSHILDTFLFSLGLFSFVNKEHSSLSLIQLAMGALLYDIGMIFLPDYVKFHKEAMDAQLKDQIRKHPIIGYNFLTNILKISHMFALPALEHHERINGSGYPSGLKEREIHEHSIVIALADEFTAQLHSRSFRKAKEPSEILKDFIHNAMQMYNGEYSKYKKAFVSYTTVYPISSIILLNTGEIAIVVEVFTEKPEKPAIKIIRDSTGNYKINGEIIYLSDKHNGHIEIKGVYTRELLDKAKNMYLTPILSWDVPENVNMQIISQASQNRGNDPEGGQHIEIQL